MVRIKFPPARSPVPFENISIAPTVWTTLESHRANFLNNLREETQKGMREKAEQGIYPSTATSIITAGTHLKYVQNDLFGRKPWKKLMHR
jgi:hypothetical protein